MAQGHAAHRPIAFRLDAGYWPRNLPLIARARAWIIGAFLRAAMRRGRVVVLVGPCGIGKTVLLERATPGQIIDKSHLVLQSDAPARVEFDLTAVPAGPFSIDEPRAFDAGSLLAGIRQLRGRGFAVAFQQARVIDDMGLADELRQHHRCITVKLGGRGRRGTVR